MTKPVSIDYKYIRKAIFARKPTPAQTALLHLRDNLQEMLGNSVMDDFADRVMENEVELLHINEQDGQIWLSVVDHRPIDIGLHELEIGDEDKEAIAEEIRRLGPALKDKKGGLVQTSGS